MKRLFNAYDRKYCGFVVLYKNPVWKLLGRLRLIPRKVVVVEISENGNERRIRVPVNTGISNNIPRVLLAEGYGLFFKLVRVFL